MDSDRGGAIYGLLAAIGFVVVVMAVIFAVCVGSAGSQPRSLGRIMMISNDGGDRYGNDDGGRYGNDNDNRRCRGNNCRGSFSPGPFDRSPVDVHDNCVSLDCSGSGGQKKQPPAQGQQPQSLSCLVPVPWHCDQKPQSLTDPRTWDNGPCIATIQKIPGPTRSDSGIGCWWATSVGSGKAAPTAGVTGPSMSPVARFQHTDWPGAYGTDTGLPSAWTSAITATTDCAVDLTTCSSDPEQTTLQMPAVRVGCRVAQASEHVVSVATCLMKPTRTTAPAGNGSVSSARRKDGETVRPPSIRVSTAARHAPGGPNVADHAGTVTSLTDPRRLPTVIAKIAKSGLDMGQLFATTTIHFVEDLFTALA